MKPMEYVVVITDVAMSAEGVAVMDVTEAMGQVVACKQRQAQQSVGTVASVFGVEPETLVVLQLGPWCLCEPRVQGMV